MPSFDFTKKPGIAVLNVFSINLIINRYDAWFFRNGGEYWAKVSPSSWKRNLESGLEWDWNSFGTNWFGHPVHGSMHYNSARSLGLSYWESSPFTFLGSFSWEYFGETHPPSGNDIMTTSFGGIYLGEMTHRLSEKLLNYKSYGMGRVWRVTLATILNPIALVNRWFHGVPQHSSNPTITEDLRAFVAFGGNFQLSSINLETKGGGPFLEFGMVYGNPYQDKKFFKPFESFEIQAWLRFVKDDYRPYPYLNVSSHALLWGTNIAYDENNSTLVGAFQHFDYLHDEVIEIGSLGYSGGLLNFKRLGKTFATYYDFHIGPSILGGSNNEIVGEFTEDPESKRDYILGPGFLFETSFVLDHQKAGRLTSRYKHFTFFVVSGPDGVEGLNLLSFRYTIPIWLGHRFGIDYTRYYRRVKYHDYPEYNNFKKDLYEFRAFVSYDF
jgi:hypothetical protein